MIKFSKIPVRYFKDISSKMEGMNLSMKGSGQKSNDILINKNELSKIDFNSSTENKKDWNKCGETDYTQ